MSNFLSRTSAQQMAERALSRAAGAPLIAGNSVQLLKDASENYPAWLDAIRAAERWIHFENYIISNDETGREFIALLTEKARAGVRVRLLYDWMGTGSFFKRDLFRPLREAGAELRCFNPPHIARPFSWLSRDHRKMLAMDGRVGFIAGLCVSQKWRANPERGHEAWRDTGVEIRGPAVAGIEQAFRQTWRAAGDDELPPEEVPSLTTISEAGEIPLRIVATAPKTTSVYRLDQLVAGIARETLWLTDAYFVGTASYVQALCGAAADGVDVRLLVPGSSDIPSLQLFTRAGYRPLLEAGIRVFEWNGPMLHAKTAVADGRWARIGSSNLNIASWMGNYELDAAIEDAAFAEKMAAMYCEDLEHSTEIMLNEKRRVRRVRSAEESEKPHQTLERKDRRGSTSRATAGALRLANSVGAAVGERRMLGLAERPIMLGAGILLFSLTLIAFFFPRVIAWPLAFFCAWMGLSLFWRAWHLHLSSKTSAAFENETEPENFANREPAKHEAPPVEKS